MHECIYPIPPLIIVPQYVVRMHCSEIICTIRCYEYITDAEYTQTYVRIVTYSSSRMVCS